MNATPETHPVMEDNDATLLAAWRRGDTEALGRLVEKYQRPLFAFLHRFASQPGEADEWFQETWVRAIRHMNFFRQQNLLGWLFRIAHNLIIDQARRKKPDCSLDAPRPESSLPLADSIPAPALSPAAEAAGRDLGRLIAAAAAAHLPVEQREVFWLRMDAGLTFKEIARIQRTSVSTALARMHYALEKLRAALGPAWREWQEIRP
jgi:RNA polymerase sigma-70 factor (ECF subfamily)